MKRLILLFSLIFVYLGASAMGILTTQKEWRWRADDGNQSTASWLAPVSQSITISDAPGQRIRVRSVIEMVDIQGNGGNVDIDLGLMFANNNGGILTSSDFGPFKIINSANVNGGVITTPQISDPTAFVPGIVVDAGNYQDHLTYAVGAGQTVHTELEWALETTSALLPGTYEMRASGAGGYVTPVITIVVTGAATNSFSYSGSPYCGTTGTATVTSTAPTGGTYTGDAGLSIDAATGAVNLAGSTTGTHTVTYTYNGGSTTTSISIRPQIADPTGTNAVPNQALCNGGTSAPVTFSSAISGLSYTWMNSNPAIGLAASGTGDLPSFTAVNSGTTTTTGQINVKPVGGTGCTFKARAFRFTVYPTPVANTVADQSLCVGSTTMPITFSGPAAGTSFAWTSSSTSVGLTARKGINTLPSFTASATPGAATTITVTPTLYGCPGTPTTFQVTTMTCMAGIGGNSDDARISLNSAIVAGPNPTTGNMRVQYSGSAQQLTVLVRDAYGTIVMPVRTYASNNLTVDMSDLRPGTYSVQFADPRTGASIVRTIVKL